MAKKKILIVDDDQDVQSLLKKRLEFNGFDCTCASTVEAGLKQLKALNPNLVILDLGFRKANGTAFLKSAREWLADDAELPPVLVLSCHNEKEIVDYVLDSGATSFITKPFDTSNLISKVQQHIR